MLSKEEISKLKINVFNQCDDETIRLVAEMLKHTEQLESDKQKLIEKLEEEKFTIESTYSQINGNYFMAQDRLDLIKQILSILKGENDEH